ncbi:MAG TPA: glycosyltransferase family 2 protein [Thermoclostridium sp.]|nr:glycosyltransferase family 2 protein [Thermoclostridium sp.]
MITILMAVYNGGRYLAEQIESILAQTERGWKLIIQDDCSSDDSADIARQFAAKYPDKITFIRRETPSGSAMNNFFSMISHVDTDYMMTCDQDDFWLPDKIRITLGRMKELEEKAGKDTPLLVHTDLIVAGSRLECLSESLFKYQRLDKTRDKLNNLLVQNIVTGCTLMANRALVEKVRHIPPNVIMHDWWLALVATAFGRIGFIDEPTVLYRQHPGNEVGAKDAGSVLYLFRRAAAVLGSPQKLKTIMSEIYAQAESFLDTYRGELSEDNLRIIEAFVSLPHVSKFRRLAIIQRYGFWKYGLARKIGQVILC